MRELWFEIFIVLDSILLFAKLRLILQSIERNNQKEFGVSEFLLLEVVECELQVDI